MQELVVMTASQYEACLWWDRTKRLSQEERKKAIERKMSNAHGCGRKEKRDQTGAWVTLFSERGQRRSRETTEALKVAREYSRKNRYYARISYGQNGQVYEGQAYLPLKHRLYRARSKKTAKKAA